MCETLSYECTSNRIPVEESTREFLREFLWRSLQDKGLDGFIDAIYGKNLSEEVSEEEIAQTAIIVGGYDRILNGLYGAFILIALILEKEKFNNVTKAIPNIEEETELSEEDKIKLNLITLMDVVAARRVFLDATGRQVTFELVYEKFDCCNGNFAVTVTIPLTNVYDPTHDTLICKAGENIYKFSVMSREPQCEFDNNPIFKVYNEAVKECIPEIIKRIYTSVTKGAVSQAKHCDACMRMGVSGDECEIEKDEIPLVDQIKFLKNEKNAFISDDFKVFQIALTDEDIAILKLRRFDYATIANSAVFNALCVSDRINAIKSTDAATDFEEENGGCCCECDEKCECEEYDCADDPEDTIKDEVNDRR